MDNHDFDIVTEPSIVLVGRTTIDESGLDKFKDSHCIDDWTTDTENGGEMAVEIAGRLCYMSFANPRPGGNKAYINHILEVGHGSVLEHATWQFIIYGVSRSFTHELVRHRAGFSYSQLSQRYVDESVAEYVVPMAIRKSPDLYRIWNRSVRESHAAYVTLVEQLAAEIKEEHYQRSRQTKNNTPDTVDEWYSAYLTNEQRTAMRKEARQAARSVLPNATETKIFVTGNARSLRHFIELRCSRHAEPEIRVLAQKLLNIMQKEAPNIFGDYEFQNLPDGTSEAITHMRKV